MIFAWLALVMDAVIALPLDAASAVAGVVLALVLPTAALAITRNRSLLLDTSRLGIAISAVLAFWVAVGFAIELTHAPATLGAEFAATAFVVITSIVRWRRSNDAPARHEQSDFGGQNPRCGRNR